MSLVDLCQQQLIGGVGPVNGSSSGVTLTMTVLPAPVTDIYQRLTDKQQQVIGIAADADDVSRLLNDVQRGELSICPSVYVSVCLSYLSVDVSVFLIRSANADGAFRSHRPMSLVQFAICTASRRGLRTVQSATIDTFV